MLRWGRREELILGEDREGTVVKNEGKFHYWWRKGRLSIVEGGKS